MAYFVSLTICVPLSCCLRLHYEQAIEKALCENLHTIIFLNLTKVVFNSPVVWWCSANLFTCKLEGGWWAPAIQQDVGQWTFFFLM